MSAIFILILASLVIAGGFLVAFLFSVKSGQFDDSYTPAVRMLFDNELKNTGKSDKKEEDKTNSTTQTNTNHP